MGRKRLTTEEFIRRAKAVHGDKYDYSKVKYTTCKEKVIVTCPEHGDFLIAPDGHTSGRGCPVCRYIRPYIVKEGFKNDKPYVSTLSKEYTCWHGMVARCYSSKNQKKCPTYIGVSVCEDWHCFSKFKEWYDKHYVEGWALDKDILVKGNKVYSPETCCFVPREINNLFTKNNAKRGKYPIGVTYIEKLNKYRVHLNDKKVRRHLGLFDTIEEAFQAYKKAKESYIKEVADKWKDKLDPRVYEALYNYTVEITD